MNYYPDLLPKNVAVHPTRIILFYDPWSVTSLDMGKFQKDMV